MALDHLTVCTFITLGNLVTLGLGQGYNSFLRETGPGAELHVYNPSTEVEAKDGKFEASLGYILSSRPARGTWGESVSKY